MDAESNDRQNEYIVLYYFRNLPTVNYSLHSSEHGKSQYSDWRSADGSPSLDSNLFSY